MLSTLVRLTALLCLMSATIALAHEGREERSAARGVGAPGRLHRQGLGPRQGRRHAGLIARWRRSGLERRLPGCVRRLQGLPPGLPPEERAESAAL